MQNVKTCNLMVQPRSRTRRLSYFAIVVVPYCLTSNDEWLTETNWKGCGWNRSRHNSCNIPTTGWKYWITPTATYVPTAGVWADMWSRYSDSLQGGRSGDRIPVGAIFSAPVQAGSGAYPASYTMSSGSFPGVKRPGRGVDNPPASSAEVKERVELYLYCPSGSILSSPLFTFWYLIRASHFKRLAL